MDLKRIFSPPRTRRLKAGRVVLNPGESVGEHTTDRREEIITVLDGKAAVLVEGKEKEVGRGEVFFVREGARHNVVNKSGERLEYVYVVGLL